MTTKRRADRIKEVEEEGREAYLSGNSRQSNPYHGTTDFTHWGRGWDDAETAAMEASAAQTAHDREQDSENTRLALLVAITEFTTAPTAIAHQRLSRLLKVWEDHIVNRTKEEIRHDN